MSQYLRFVLVRDTGKTLIYNVVSVSQDVPLGQVRWYGRWRQYVFEPIPNTIWNKDCLRELANFLDGLMKERRVAADIIR